MKSSIYAIQSSIVRFERCRIESKKSKIEEAMRQIIIITVLFSMLNLFAQTSFVVCELREADKIEISIDYANLPAADSLFLYRSSCNLKQTGLNIVQYPISKYEIPLQPKIPFVDSLFADNTTYYYQLVLKKDNSLFGSEVCRVDIPNKVLPAVSNPYFLVDKFNYILQLWDTNHLAKTYPIALGRNPVKRKLNRDKSSTPEGIYTIYNLQPQATFYKAFDIDYPNAVDRARYNYYSQENLPPFANHNPAIGGEIQIHGYGINRNWTFGCMAMRNRDMDELFAADNIKAGIKVVIIGSQFQRDDIPFLLKSRKSDKCKQLQSALEQRNYYSGAIDGIYGAATGRALAGFQQDNGLTITCDFDKETTECLLRDR